VGKKRGRLKLLGRPVKKIKIVWASEGNAPAQSRNMDSCMCCVASYLTARGRGGGDGVSPALGKNGVEKWVAPFRIKDKSTSEIRSGVKNSEEPGKGNTYGPGPSRGRKIYGRITASVNKQQALSRAKTNDTYLSDIG